MHTTFVTTFFLPFWINWISPSLCCFSTELNYQLSVRVCCSTFRSLCFPLGLQPWYGHNRYSFLTADWFLINRHFLALVHMHGFRFHSEWRVLFSVVESLLFLTDPFASQANSLFDWLIDFLRFEFQHATGISGNFFLRNNKPFCWSMQISLWCHH